MLLGTILGSILGYIYVYDTYIYIYMYIYICITFFFFFSYCTHKTWHGVGDLSKQREDLPSSGDDFF